ncbi:glutathione S-transferase family protein [Thalassococcus sp. S3]|uniref:glutathione S-transferase family protein n=1 Tax=Thalassococcus sp. S3 TaxID=2017482 RepID=UPI0010240664|nr:glutathione S-transferase family protein [Thalassococcus sp. S3]QBF31916.1 glutathione S-transferase [Thalassococcus sp. S3]
MKLYFAPDSRAVRVAWALEELGLDYEIETFQLGDKAMRAPDYLKVHPMGRVPALEDGDVTLFESGAILQYLLARYDPDHRLSTSPDHPDFPAYLQWFHYAEGMVMPPVNSITVETVLLPPERRSEVHAKRALKLLGQMLTAVERHVDGREFLAGAFSGADIMTGSAVMVARRMGADFSDKPNLAAYAERLAARPALQKANTL